MTQPQALPVRLVHGIAFHLVAQTLEKGGRPRLEYRAGVDGHRASLLAFDGGGWAVLVHGAHVTPSSHGETPEEAVAGLPKAIVACALELERVSSAFLAATGLE
jgi:hypothetical protein